MSFTSPELESQMQAIMEELLSQYKSLDQLVCSMLTKQHAMQPIDNELQKLKSAQDKTTLFEKQTREARKNYFEVTAKASANIMSLTNQAKALLIELKTKIERLEQNAQSTYKKLTPQLDQGVRANQMNQAYKQS